MKSKVEKNFQLSIIVFVVINLGDSAHDVCGLLCCRRRGLGGVV